MFALNCAKYLSHLNIYEVMKELPEIQIGEIVSFHPSLFE
jgi:hypothetical protein